MTVTGFENGRAGWEGFWGEDKVSLDVVSTPTYRGSHALRLTISGSGQVAVGTGQRMTGLRPGTTVTYHVLSKGSGSARLRPFVYDTSYRVSWALDDPGVLLSPGPGWKTVTWKIPNIPGLHDIGFQVDHPGSGNLVLALDDVSWPSGT